MKERPILFSAPMVRALLDGSKTQTRRIVKPQPDRVPPMGYRVGDALMRLGGEPMYCPYGQPGERLWVREAWRTEREFDHLPPRDLNPTWPTPVQYEAGPYAEVLDGKLRPGMFMPRWASRISLEITDVRVERLQDISEADALAEGIDRHDVLHDGNPPPGFHAYTYRRVWEQINGPGTWDANPFVWAVSFRRINAS